MRWTVCRILDLLALLAGTMERTRVREVHLNWLRYSVVVALVLFLLPALSADPAVRPAQAATLSVCPSGPPSCGYAHIQDAVNAAFPGDTISVAAGTYTETVSISTSLTLAGAGASSTVIDGNQSGTVVTVNAGATVAITGVAIQGGDINSTIAGGGLFIAGGTVALTNSTVISNSAYFGGGIYIAGGAVTLTNSTVISNSDTDGNGAGIYNAGTLALNNSTVISNSGTLGSFDISPYGGGIYNSGTLTLTNSIVAGNRADDGGGVYNLGALALSYSTVSVNSASYNGGGIDNVEGTLTLSNSAVISNSATYNGGGLIVGGGAVTLANSAIISNSATGNHFSFTKSLGGGIYIAGGTVTLTNSTVAGNSAPYTGGGIDNWGTLMLTNSTVSGNNGGDGGGVQNSGTLTLTNTILAGNTAPGSPGTSDCSGTLTSGGYNLVGVGDGCGLTNGVNGDQVGTVANPLNARLGPLQDNGGPTLTMAPLPGSPAIDAVAPGNCVLSTDQRGLPRPDEAGDNGFCDIGAVEVQEGSSPTATPSPTATNSPTGTPTPTATGTPTPTATSTPLPPTATVIPVAAKVQLSPASGAGGSTIIVMGSRFAAGERVTLRFYCAPGACGGGSVEVGTATADGSGTFSTEVTVPLFAPLGHHGVGAVGAAGSFAWARFTVTASPTLQVLPNSGPAGASITVRGTGFASGEQVALSFYCWPNNCGRATLPLGTATADSTGAFTLTTTVLSFAPAGSHGVGATGMSSGLFVNAVYTVTSQQAIALVPSSGADGSTFTVNGSGFGPHEQVPLRFYCWPENCGAGTVPLGTATTDGDGAFTLQVRVPAHAPPGPHGVGGIGQSSNLGASTPFLVTVAASPSRR